MAKRRRAREVVLQMLYQLEMSKVDADDSISLYKTSFGEGPRPDEFSIQLFKSVSQKIGELDEAIIEASDNWRIERMSSVDRNILRIGVYELRHEAEIPVKVAINEAVEMAKRYGTEDSASFVNGILDRIAREVRDLS